MKYRFFSIALLTMVALSCTVSEIDVPQRPAETSVVFYATIEDQSDDTSTRTYTNESLRIFWNSSDTVTVFNNTPVAEPFVFVGENGATSGRFDRAINGSFVTGDPIGGIYSVFPHRETTQISEEGIISFTLPELQLFQGSKSFGKNADVMVAKTDIDDNRLRFKNAGGFLSFKLYGSGVSVSSVILKSNNGEPLAGDCTIDMSEGLPKLTMTENATDEVRIYCEKPVSLASSPEEYTEFMFVLPPGTFGSEGFTLFVTTPDGRVFIKEIPVALEIERNRIKRFAPLQVVPDPPADNLRIISLSSDRGGRTYPAVLCEEHCADTLTIPTITDFSALPLDFVVNEGDVVWADGRKIASGDKVNASKPVTLMVCRGYQEKRYTLVARNTGLPVVRIKTTGFVQKDLDDDTNHETWRPKEGSDETAFITIEYPDGAIATFNNNSLAVKDVKTQIKGRGNATWTYDKRPYALKFDKKHTVLGIGKKGASLSKRWILLANWKDRTLLRNDAAFWLSEQTDLPFTVDGRFVELEFNGVHRGNYYLCEQIKIENGRVSITEIEKVPYADKTGGFLMEIDNNWDEKRKFQSAVYKLRYQFKSPDVDLATDTTFNAAFAYMQAFIGTVENKIKNRTSDYKDYFDIDSAIWFMFVNELTGNGDFYNENWSATYKGPHSTFLYKDRDAVDGRLHMGPVWDFDYLTFMASRSKQWVGANHSGYYYVDLFKDKAFRKRVSELWEEYSKKEVKQGLLDYIDRIKEEISLSEPFNTEMWGYTGYQQDQNGDNLLSFQDAVDAMKTAFSAKWDWMDEKFESLEKDYWNW